MNQHPDEAVYESHILPEPLLLRQIKVSVNQSGVRIQGFYIITTLLDEKAYTADYLINYTSNAGMLSCSFVI